MMKRLIISILWALGKLWSLLYSHKISEKFNLFKIIFYSAWISTEFRSFGKKSRILSFSCLIGGKHISIGKNCCVGKRAVITAWDKYYSQTFSPSIILGNNVSIGDDCHITAINRIEIGDNVLTGKKITITDNSHGESKYEQILCAPILRPLYSDGPVIIEKNVWIGDKVTILPNVRIGKNSIIGANAVVTKNIPANCIAGGIPAVVIKHITDK